MSPTVFWVISFGTWFWNEMRASTIYNIHRRPVTYCSDLPGNYQLVSWIRTPSGVPSPLTQWQE